MAPCHGRACSWRLPDQRQRNCWYPYHGREGSELHHRCDALLGLQHRKPYWAEYDVLDWHIGPGAYVILRRYYVRSEAAQTLLSKKFARLPLLELRGLVHISSNHPAARLPVESNGITRKRLSCETGSIRVYSNGSSVLRSGVTDACAPSGLAVHSFPAKASFVTWSQGSRVRRVRHLFFGAEQLPGFPGGAVVMNQSIFRASWDGCFT